MIKDKKWKIFLSSVFEHEKFKTLIEKVKNEYDNNPGKIFPKKNEIFNAFELTSFENLRIIILGQEPYPTNGHSHGLAFSSLSYNRPRSLANIYSEIYSDIGFKKRAYSELFSTNDLTCWSKQGILLLNTTLTVKENEIGSHANIGWEWFAEMVITELNKIPYPLVFMLWGSKAQIYEQIIDKKHFVIKTSQPSPMSYEKGFKNNKQFSEVSKFIANTHTGQNNPLRIPIEWFVSQNPFEHCYRINIGDGKNWIWYSVTIRALYNEWFKLVFPNGIMTLHNVPAKQAFKYLDKLHTIMLQSEFNKYATKKELLFAIEDLYKKYENTGMTIDYILTVQYDLRHDLL